MKMDSFINNLYEAAKKEPKEAGGSKEDLSSVLGSGTWKYVPKQRWNSGTLRVVVEEVTSGGKWKIYFCLGSTTTDKEAEDIASSLPDDIAKEIKHYQQLVMENNHQAINEAGGAKWHGDTSFQPGKWRIDAVSNLSFEQVLKGCVYLVTEGKGGTISPESFKSSSK